MKENPGVKLLIGTTDLVVRAVGPGLVKFISTAGPAVEMNLTSGMLMIVAMEQRRCLNV